MPSTDIHLPWQNISWETFETLSQEVISYSFNILFEKYRRSGYSQDGIDLINVYEGNNRTICIQCKRVIKFSATDLKEAVKKFKDGKFYQSADYFFILTKADTAAIKPLIHLYQKEFKKQDIVFDCWGKDELETSLRYKYGIVKRYFGIRSADDFSFRMGVKKTDLPYEPVKYYLQRSIFIRKKDKHLSFQFYGIEPLDPMRLFDDIHQASKKICLISDPYQGKSTLLRQLAFFLRNESTETVPLFLDLKGQNQQTIESLLELNFSEWKETPARDLVIIIDGLDEVPANEFLTFAQHICNFEKENEMLTIVISCRSPFYEHYNLSTHLQKFERYEFCALSQLEIRNYVVGLFGPKKAELFLQLTEKNNLDHLLGNVFNLTELVAIYRETPASFPRNAMVFMDLISKRSLKLSDQRRLGTSELFFERQKEYTDNIEKMALVLQLMATNAIADTDLQNYFSKEIIDLFKHSAILTKSGGKWMFTSAYYQEHLAARLFSRHDMPTIEKICCIGNRVKKIRPKWMQTIASLFEFVEGDKKQTLIAMVSNDNPELLVKADPIFFSISERTQILKAILNKYSANNIRPLLSSYGFETHIASFITGLPDGFSIVISCITTRETERFKQVCWNILYHLSLSNTQRVHLDEIAMGEILATKDSYYVRRIIHVMLKQGLITTERIQGLIDMLPHMRDSHEFREGIYESVLHIKADQEFMDFAIEGASVLLKYNQAIHHSMSEQNLLRIFRMVATAKQIGRLFQIIGETTWSRYFHHNSEYHDKFMPDFIERAVAIHETDPLAFIAVARYILNNPKSLTQNEFTQAAVFFLKTNTSHLLVELFTRRYSRRWEWNMVYFLNAECCDYFICEFEEDRLAEGYMREIWNSLRYTKNEEMADTFREQMSGLLGTDPYAVDQTSIDTYLKQQAKSYANDLKYLKSKAALRKGVRAFFKSFGKRSLTHDQLYIEQSNRRDFSSASSAVLQQFLMQLLRRNNTVLLSDALKQLDNRERYEFFRAEILLSGSYIQEKEREAIFEPILHSYYEERIESVDFRNAVIENEGLTHYANPQHFLADIFRKRQYKTSFEAKVAMIWMDYDYGTLPKKGEKENSYRLTQVIIDSFNEEETESLKEKVLQELRDGIAIPSVMLNYVEISRSLHITEALPEILTVFLSSDWNSREFKTTLDAYMDLSTDYLPLLEKLDGPVNYNAYYYHDLISKLLASHPSACKDSLSKCIQSASVEEDKRFWALQKLASLGDEAAFREILEDIQAKGKVDRMSHSFHQLANIDTKTGLTIIHSMMGRILEPDHHDHHFESARTAIVELLFDFGKKGEDDVLMVDAFLRDCAYEYQLAGKHNYKDFLWYAENILEKFRSAEAPVISEKNIRSILSLIDITAPIEQMV